MRFLGHSTVRLELAGSVVLTDPVLTARVGPLRRTSPLPDRAHFADADLVLLSHLHADHLHLPSLRLLPRTVRVVAPRGAGRWLRGRGIRNVEELAPGEELEHGDLRVHGVPAAHSGHRFGPRSTHGPQAAAMGHLIEAGGNRIYAAGDTDLFPGMAGFGPLAAALLPVWGWGLSLGPGHLDPHRAAEAVGLLRPRVAVPVHWGTLAVGGLPRLPRVGARMRRLLVEPPHRFAAAVAAAGERTRVLVTEPGAAVVLDGMQPVVR
ncbi:L-ascorbate metabolism protein UlaG (beta-lactamase superfamily) [Pseudonocardia cypriaca]|uniref:L-ascorbate metabolism protein UlaG (Beta-lactamase superfamily) n=2 Tax=Pseudonocardia cypriaca TaxID=882449 RepID=A0A543FWQ8_9PSEU|nr:L-ascorbate metabolism protein UlaG (beta-lactamase superfamily) [Pseudonocardia cypriaca]